MLFAPTGGVSPDYGLQNLALVFTSAANAALISAGVPVAAVVLAKALLKEPIPPARLFGIGLSVLGVGLVSGTTPSGGGLGTILGNALMVVAVVAYGAYAVHYTKLHAMSKAVFLGVISLCASSVVTGDPAIIYRAILIGAFLLVTTPISALVIARPAFLRGERMQTPDARDESGKGLPRSS